MPNTTLTYSETPKQKIKKGATYLPQSHMKSAIRISKPSNNGWILLTYSSGFHQFLLWNQNLTNIDLK